MVRSFSHLTHQYRLRERILRRAGERFSKSFPGKLSRPFIFLPEIGLTLKNRCKEGFDLPAAVTEKEPLRTGEKRRISALSRPGSRF